MKVAEQLKGHISILLLVLGCLLFLYLKLSVIYKIYDIPVNQEVYTKAKKDFLENRKLTKKGSYNAVKDFCDKYSFCYEFKKSTTKIISYKK